MQLPSNNVQCSCVLNFYMNAPTVSELGEIFISKPTDSYQIFYWTLKLPDFLQSLIVPFHLIDVHGQVLQRYREALRHHISRTFFFLQRLCILIHCVIVQHVFRSRSITACGQCGAKRPVVSDRALGPVWRMMCGDVGRCSYLHGFQGLLQLLSLRPIHRVTH